MGEAARRRENAHLVGPWPGSRSRCPTCLGTQVVCGSLPDNIRDDFYAREIAICGGCGAAWEPIDEALIWDPDDPMCSFSEPCDNCAFRPGSPEQRDKEAWKARIIALSGKDGGRGGIFYCHRGLCLAPGSEDGFAYPTKTTMVLGHTVVLKDTSKMRICRGYLNAFGQWMKALGLETKP